ncbi:DoxX family protein [Hymenobacter sp. BT635]|uniref:DoxX family protein n=1 Tax=Hymenobacter nitidus TaxID=2880929 RepID=A0ABS8AF34_9BACT|nr:DoxX family protein [Hymenobacter nitidus]MCB2378977.1 DoxX family protein [Hymenobacter nitidus]
MQTTYYPDAAVLVLRLFLGGVLVYGVLDNVVSAERMMEFEKFLAQHQFPLPPVAARLSVYAQLGCGLLIGLGLFTRFAAAVMIVNFLVALLMVHQGLPFAQNIAPLAMLMGSISVALSGPGRYAVAPRPAMPHNA